MLTVMLWLQEAPTGSVPTAVVVAIIGFLGIVVTAIGTAFYMRSRSDGVKDAPAPVGSSASDALLEREEGAWRQRLETMVERFGSTLAAANEKLVATIAAGDTEHRMEIKGFSEAVRDSTTAMRACVDQIMAQRADIARLEKGLAAALPLRRRRRKP